QKYLGFERDDWAIQLALAFLSVPLAWLSLQYVERPFRSRDRICTRGAVFCLGGGTVATLVFLSSMVWWSKGAENRLSPEARMLASAVDDFAFLHELDENDIPQKLIPIGTGERH